MRNEADLIVVGGGFAGLSVAQAAASRGLRTIVLERRPAIGHSPNTTGIIVKELADVWDVPRRMTRKIHGVRLYGPSLQWVDLVSPGYFFLATDTSAVLKWWADEARRAGAIIRCGAPYRGATRDGQWIRMETGSDRDRAQTERLCRRSGSHGPGDAGHHWRARYLVGADGVTSSVARDFELGRNRRFLAGVEAEMENVSGVDGDVLHVFLDSDLARGYIGWVVPGVGGIAQVGLAARRPVPLQLNRFIEKVSALFDFSRARTISHRAGKIPVGGPVRPIGCANVMLTGDAAGLVSPLTAGGIHTAVDLGRHAGLAICDHLLDGGRDPVVVLRRHLPRFHAKRLLRIGADVMTPPNWAIDLAMRTSPFRALAQTVFFHHRGLWSFEAWRDAIWRVAMGRA